MRSRVSSAASTPAASASASPTPSPTSSSTPSPCFRRRRRRRHRRPSRSRRSRASVAGIRSSPSPTTASACSWLPTLAASAKLKPGARSFLLTGTNLTESSVGQCQWCQRDETTWMLGTTYSHLPRWSCSAHSSSLMMSPSALPMMSREKQGFVCTELNKLLREYCCQHPWEPSYKLDVICGVMESSRSYGSSTLYHANFLASNADYTCTSSQTKATLFFAEFWEASFTKVVELKSFSCKRIKNHSHTGRCSICEKEA